MAGETMNKIKSSFNRGITTISLKTSSTIEKSKIKTHIDSLNREIARELAASGEEAYKIWLDGKTDFSELIEKFEGIQGKYKEIEDLTAELSAID